jgi:hypothetical protein
LWRRFRRGRDALRRCANFGQLRNIGEIKYWPEKSGIALRAYEEILSSELGKNADAQLGKILTSSPRNGFAVVARGASPTGRANAHPMTGSAMRLEGWMQRKDLRPSFATPRNSAVPQDEASEALEFQKRFRARLTPGLRSPCPAPLAQQRAARSEPDRASMTRNRARSHGRTPPMPDRRRARRRCRP